VVAPGARGFTLIEALIAISLFAFILVTSLMIYDSNQKTYVRGEAEMDVQQNVRVALGQILHDVRMAGYDPSNAIAAQTVKQPLQPVPDTGTTLSNTELRLITDVDQDGISDCVAFRLSGGQVLWRKTSWSSGACTWAGTESTVAEGITALTFTYFTGPGSTSTTDPAQARRVRVVITGGSASQGTSSTTQSEASLRQ
jgi:prepilin-type N-terminal cleavage/methylation domain-containing protein